MKAEELLPLHLGVQVPLYIAELKEKGGPDKADFALMQEAGRALAAKGDRLLYRCEKKGETAALVGELAFGIAILSFLPGGVTTFGYHWESGFTQQSTEGEKEQ